MIVCRKCSRRHADGAEFCSCGAYLAFDGEHVSEPGATSAPPDAPHHPPDATLERPPAARQTAPAPWSGFDATTDEPPDGGIEAVLPDAPVHASTSEPVWVHSAARAGETPCRQCGTPNDPEHFFCRHCGESLSGAVGPTTTPPLHKTPWWRRVFARGRARVGATDATTVVSRAHGLARGGVSGRTLLFRTGGVMVLLAGCLAFLGPWRGPVLAKGRQLLGVERHDAIDVSADEVASVSTDQAVAPTTFDLQGPGNVVDRFANTAWATRWLDVGFGFETIPEEEGCQPEPMTDSQLVFEFDEPRDIGRIRVLGGRSELDESRTLFLRPRVLELRFGDDETCSYALLDDVGDLTPLGVEGGEVSSVTVRIVGVHEADAPSEIVEISEIVFEE